MADEWRFQLEKDGFVVVRNVLSPERCQYYIDAMYNWLESFPYGFNRNDPSTFGPEYLPANMKGGMYHGYSVQHEKFVWEARMEPAVVETFSQLWDTRELLVSFDGINFTLPCSASMAGVDGKPWPHVDQSPLRKGRHCIQGIINFAPSGPKDGGLIVVKGSHALMQEYFKDHDAKKADWGSEDWRGFEEEQLDWFSERGCEVTKVCAGPGDLILWDSRTIHWNKLPETESLRALVYACFTPASLARQENLAIKKEIFKKRQGTTHWPHDNFFIQAWTPPRLGKPDSYVRHHPREEPVLSSHLLRLAGVESY